ncbi:hypothetical protein, partial [Streptomyces sp. RP5T]|uniref:hypothetical protein n=1 Tax=Streptomyces sp. RP5T TaxID=2490848 RepID=UPI001C8C9449
MTTLCLVSLKSPGSDGSVSVARGGGSALPFPCAVGAARTERLSAVEGGVGCCKGCFLCALHGSG